MKCKLISYILSIFLLIEPFDFWRAKGLRQTLENRFKYALKNKKKQTVDTHCCVRYTAVTKGVAHQMFRNWALINAKRKERWNAMDEPGKIHMLEETELNKKAKILLQSVITKLDTGEYSLQLNGLSFVDTSICRILEKGFSIKWDIHVNIKKYPGIRFEKLDGCGPIIEKETPSIQRKLGNISVKEENKELKLAEALKLLSDANPQLGAAVQILLQGLKK